MSIEGLLIGLAVLAVTGIWIIAPLFSRSAKQDSLKQEERAELVGRYERLLRNIRDLDEDLTTGKVSPEAHARDRERWVTEGVVLLKAIDELGGDTTLPAGGDLDAQIEQAVAAYRHRLKAAR